MTEGSNAESIARVDRRATTVMIADALRERILDGTLAPGSLLGERFCPSNSGSAGSDPGGHANG